MSAAPAQARTTVKLADVEVERNVAVQMRDGVTLCADVYWPRATEDAPVLVMRTPYDKVLAQTIVYQHPVWYARNGYIVAVVDTRGRYASGGAFYPLRSEALDGYDTVEWAARLPGSCGRVGMYGFSYAGATQLLAATETPPSLICLAVGATPADYYDGLAYENGAFRLFEMVTWVLDYLAGPDLLRRGRPDLVLALSRVRQRAGERGRYTPAILSEIMLILDEGELRYLSDWIDHDRRDAYWTELALDHRLDRISVPCLHIGGWYDVFAGGTTALFSAMSRCAGDDPGREQRLVMGPWVHVPWSRQVGPRDFGPLADNHIDELQLRWFDRWLKQESRNTQPAPVSIFTMGPNRWQHVPTWPPPDIRCQHWYLHSLGRATSISADGRLAMEEPDDQPADVFVALPSNPVPSLGGRSSSAHPAAAGPVEQALAATRNDVLVYTSEALSTEYEISGEVELVLYAATDARDTDWAAKLVAVSTSGSAINICSGLVRARFRHSLAKPVPVEPYEPQRYVIRLGPTSVVLGAGDRLRVQISSTDWPAYDANTQTGEPRPGPSAPATQIVYHEPHRASHLRLPVVSNA